MLAKIYLCPSTNGCTWEGSSDDIYEHFCQEHEDLLSHSDLIEIALHANSENRLLLLDTEIYLLQTRINEDCLRIFLRYLGPSKIACKLTYDINLCSNGIKMRKQDIEINDGCFSITRECLQSYFGDIPKIECQLLISGEFVARSSSSSPTDSILFQEDFPKNELENSIPDLQKLFSHPEPVKLRHKKKYSLDESNNYRATWYATENDSPKERVLLSRSQTFSSEDLKKTIIVRRQSSVRSLSAIPEADLDSDPKCCCCDSYLAPPVFLCVSNHIICNDCYRNKTLCPICNNLITSNRHLKLEDKIVTHKFTCINKKNGCPWKLPYNEIVEHEINCSFCQFLCPVEGCGYNSGYKNMVSHLNLIHSSVKMLQSFIAVFQKYQELFLISETMGIFYCSWTQLENSFIWKAKFCGPKGRHFFCELKFKGKNFKKPLLLTKRDDCFVKEMGFAELKEQKLKPKHSILTIMR